jgi:hypothetical protein
MNSRGGSAAVRIVRCRVINEGDRPSTEAGFSGSLAKIHLKIN